jgi:hypothetical protein
MTEPAPGAEYRDAIRARGVGGTWAKIEIFLGLSAAGVGLMLGLSSLLRPVPGIDWAQVGGGLALFVLGGYLALAGHRSHLYRSLNSLAAYLTDEIQRSKQREN